MSKQSKFYEDLNDLLLKHKAVLQIGANSLGIRHIECVISDIDDEGTEKTFKLGSYIAPNEY